MLKWPSGPRASDGVWAPVWYGAVEQSTGFAPPPASAPVLDASLRAIADAARPYYERLARDIGLPRRRRRPKVRQPSR